MKESYLYALNENYKAAITTLEFEDKEDKYEICIYHWSEEEIKDEGSHLWERIAGPFVVDSESQANILAHEQLSLFTGEADDESLSEDFRKEVETILGDDDFQCLKPQNFEAHFLKEDTKVPLKPSKIIYHQELYFVESEDLWFIGVLENDQIIHCFKQAETLKEALSSVNI